MRIGIDTHFVTTGSATGNRTYIVELMDALVAHDSVHEYFLYAVTEHPFYARFADRCNVTIRYNLSANGWIRNFVSLPRAVAQDQLDVIHLQFIMAPYIAAPVVLWLPDLYYVHQQKALTYEWGIGQITSWSAHWATHVVTLSEYSRWDIQRSLSLPSERISITSAAAHERFTPISDPNRLAQVKAKFGIERDYILFVGRTEDPRKNIHTLLDAYIRLRRTNHITEQLIIAGRHGPGTRLLQDKILASGLHDDIFLPGVVDDEDLPALMSGAQVFVYAPSFEGFGLPVLEALSCGAPVITANVTSLPEVAGQAAVYVAPGSVAEMEAALYMVLSQPGLRRQMHQSALQQAAKFSWDRTAAATLEALERATIKRLC